MRLSSTYNTKYDAMDFVFSEDKNYIVVCSDYDIYIHSFPEFVYHKKIKIKYPLWMCFISATDFVVITTMGYCFKCNIFGEKKSLGKIPIKDWDEFSPLYKLNEKEIITCSKHAVWAIDITTFNVRQISQTEISTPVVIYNPFSKEYFYYERYTYDYKAESLQLKSLTDEKKLVLAMDGKWDTVVICYDEDGTIYANLQGKLPRKFFRDSSWLVHFDTEGKVINKVQEKSFKRYFVRIDTNEEYVVLYPYLLNKGVCIYDKNTLQKVYQIQSSDSWTDVLSRVRFTDDLMVVCSLEHIYYYIQDQKERQ